MVLAERAQNYLAQGKRAMERKDLERILAEDSSTKACATSSLNRPLEDAGIDGANGPP